MENVACRIFMIEIFCKCSIGRPKKRLQDIIKIDFKEIFCKDEK
jgi:hypothetical protein